MCRWSDNSYGKCIAIGVYIICQNAYAFQRCFEGCAEIIVRVGSLVRRVEHIDGYPGRIAARGCTGADPVVKRVGTGIAGGWCINYTISAGSKGNTAMRW